MVSRTRALTTRRTTPALRASGDRGRRRDRLDVNGLDGPAPSIRASRRCSTTHRCAPMVAARRRADRVRRATSILRGLASAIAQRTTWWRAHRLPPRRTPPIAWRRRGVTLPADPEVTLRSPAARRRSAARPRCLSDRTTSSRRLASRLLDCFDASLRRRHARKPRREPYELAARTFAEPIGALTPDATYASGRRRGTRGRASTGWSLRLEHADDPDRTRT